MALLVGVFLTKTPDLKHESIKEVMRDAVLHESNRISLFGIMEVNPGFISALVVSVLLLLFAAIIRIFVIPRFKIMPGRFQMALEKLVMFFTDFAKENSPHRYGFLSVYIFGAGTYIFCGTVFELLGIQAITTHGSPIALPAPLSDINGAIAMGCLSYLVMLSGGFVESRLKGIGKGLKDFSMPLSMSFRLFGAMLSGVLVTELVYYYKALSFVLPVFIGVLFTLLHALVQTYVLIILTSMTYGELTEPTNKKIKRA